MSASIAEFSFGDLRFDWMSVLRGQKRLPLTGYERQILEYVVIRRPSLVNAASIASHLYGRTPSMNDIRRVWSLLHNLRKKLREAGTIVTVESHLTGTTSRHYSADLQLQAAE